MKYRLISLLMLGISGFLLMYTLVIYSRWANHKMNGFIRLFPPHTTVPLHNVDLIYDSWYIAGASSTRIYFGNYTLPTRLLSTSFNLSDTLYISLKTGNLTRPVNWTTVKIKIDSPNVYILDGNTPGILHADISRPSVQNDTGKITFFTLALPVSPNHFILRSFSRKWNRNILANLSLHPEKFTPDPSLLTVQQDGIFSTDGMLHYDRATGTAVYLYYYRNQFLVMDSNLVLKYKGQTIDTVSQAQITLAGTGLSNQTTLSSPPLFVNKSSCISGNYLFVHSGLRANNETEKIFDDYPSIDVYDLRNGKYKYSFRLPQTDGKKLSSFKVYGNYLIVMYENIVETFRITLPG